TVLLNHGTGCLTANSGNTRLACNHFLHSVAVTSMGSGSSLTMETTVVPAAKELIERNLSAMGGREALLARRSYHATGTFELPQQNVRGSLEIFGKPPDKFWLKVEIPNAGR